MSDINSMAAGEYVLGTLDPLERRAFERRLASDPLLQAQVAEWERDLAPLLDSVEPQAPSPDVWDRIDASIDQMQSGDNVVSIRRPLSTRRPFMQRRASVALGGAIAASIAALAFVRLSAGPDAIPAQPATQATAPALPSQPGLAPAGRTVIATPCPDDASKSVQIASGSRKSSTPREAAAGSVSAASAARDQGGVVIGGRVAGAEPQRGKPEGSGNVTIASAAAPQGSNNVTIASAARPEGSGNVSIAAAPRPEGSNNISIASAPRPEGSGNVSIAAASRPEGPKDAAASAAKAPNSNGAVTIASANSDCK